MYLFFDLLKSYFVNFILILFERLHNICKIYSDDGTYCRKALICNDNNIYTNC